MRIQVEDVQFFQTDCPARIPFQFGKAVVKSATVLLVRVQVKSDGGVTAAGYAAETLVPRWFDKSPDSSPADDVLALIRSARLASESLSWNGSAQSVFDHWYDMYVRRVLGCDALDSSLLVRGFGVSLLERALMDAACRAHEVTFFQALRENMLGFEGGRLHPELNDWIPANGLGDTPSESVSIRHTIGFLDPLRSEDVDAAEADGLPRSLEECIDRYGLSRFKIKLSGDREQDQERILQLGGLLDERVKGNLEVSFDGNEQFSSVADLLAFLECVGEDPCGERMLKSLCWIEQPLSRTLTFDRPAHEGIEELRNTAPLIIDEADFGLDAFRRAVGIGYSGVSVKGCKGVFRALANRGLCEVLSGDLFQTAEDLTTLPAVGLQQDLSIVAAFGFESVERNGHHFFRGLDHLSKEEQETALQNAPRLYGKEGDLVHVLVEDGALCLGDLQATGFGFAGEPRVEEWKEALE